MPDACAPPAFYVPQTTPFTCGAAALLMALRRLDPRTAVRREDEFQIWREANAVFMGGGHAGCEPHALALAAARRAGAVRLWERGTARLMDRWNRQAERRAVAQMMRAEDARALAAQGVPVEDAAFDPERLAAALRAGWQPIVLVNDDGVLHWVLLLALDRAAALYADPYISGSAADLAAPAKLVREPRAAFLARAVHGRARACAVVLVGTAQ